MSSDSPYQPDAANSGGADEQHGDATPEDATPEHPTPEHATPGHPTPEHPTSDHSTAHHSTADHLMADHAAAGSDVLLAGDGGDRRKPASWWMVGGATALVLAMVGGVALAVQSLSGGGSQPEDALPAGAFAFADLDLDPSAGQKIDAVRFLRKFPYLKDKVREDDDLRQVAFEAVADDAGWGDVDFDKDVAPWLGQRIGVAAYAPDKKETGSSGPDDFMAYPDPKVVIAVQVSDESKAREGLDLLSAKARSDHKPGYVLADGYALLAENQDQADQAAADAQDGSLSEASAFDADMSALDDGVATAWMDMEAASEAMGLSRAMGMGIGSFPGAAGSGRSSYVLRFDGPDAVEVTGKVVGAESVAGIERPVEGLTELPASSSMALGLTDGDKLVTAFFEAMGKAFAKSDIPDAPSWEESIAEGERELGINLPEDLSVLLGSNLVAAFDGAGTQEHPFELGARVTTDGDRATGVLRKIERAFSTHGEQVPIVHRQTDDGVIVASSPGYASKLAQRGTLGEDKAFRRALPDVDDAGFALWVDVHALATATGWMDENLDPIEGVGVTAVSDGAGSATYRLRLVTR